MLARAMMAPHLRMVCSQFGTCASACMTCAEYERIWDLRPACHVWLCIGAFP